MKNLLDVLKTVNTYKRSIMYAIITSLLLRKKYKPALTLTLVDLYLRRRNKSNLVSLGAETRLYNKYLGLHVVTFRDDDTLTALDLQTLAQDHAHKHVVFLAADGHPALWAPVMAKLIASRGLQHIVVHACSLNEVSTGNLSKWIRHELVTQETDRVILVAHASESTAAVAAFLRSSPELAPCVHCVFVNPLANLLFPRNLPLKHFFLSNYADLFARCISFTRVLHDRLVPFVDPIILEYALLNAKTSNGGKQLDASTPLPASCSIVCGDQDWSCGRSAYEELNRSLGGRKPVEFLRGLGSYPHLEDPEKMAETIRELIDSKIAN